VVKRQNNKKNLFRGALRTIRDYSRRLQVIVDAHPKKFIGVKLQQTVFLTGLSKILYIGIVLHCTKKKASDNYKGL